MTEEEFKVGKLPKGAIASRLRANWDSGLLRLDAGDATIYISREDAERLAKYVQSTLP